MMVAESINTRINKLVLPPEEIGVVEPNMEQPAEQPADNPFDIATGEAYEPTAGLKDIVVKGAKAVKQKRVPRQQQKPLTETEQVEELGRAVEMTGLGTAEEGKEMGRVQQKVKQEPVITVDELEAKVEQKKIELEQAAPEELKPPTRAFNLPLIDDSTDIQALTDSVVDLAGIDTKTITFEKVIESAKQAGVDAKFVQQLIDNKVQVDPVNTYKAMEAQKASLNHLTDLMTKVKNGQATEAEMLEATQTIAFHSLLQRSVKGYQTNVAQSLAVMRIPREGFVDLAEVTGGLVNPNELKSFATKFLDERISLQDKVKMIDAQATGTFKDRILSVYINGLLARPGTHVRQFVANTLMLPLTMTEKMGAAMIGGTRQALGIGTKDRYYATELVSQLSGTMEALRDGAKMAAFSFREGYPSTLREPTRIEVLKRRTEIFDYKEDSPLAGFFKTTNFIATLPGRSLMTADEFFKGIHYRYELEALATRNAIQSYDTAIESGADVAVARKAYDDAVQDAYDNPPDELMQLARERTFTEPLTGAMAEVSKFANRNDAVGFITKINMPFIQTPVNITLQTLERTPIAALALTSKRIRSDLLADPKSADMALAKVGTGTGLTMMMANYAANDNLTGGGPADKGQRDALIRQGWQPYSMVLNFSEITDQTREALAALPVDVRYGSGDYEGKVFVAYTGMEPIGSFLAMAANYVDYSRYEDDNSKVNTAAAAATYGFYDYMMNHPFLQGINGVAEIIGGTYGADQDKTVKMVDQIAQTFVTFGGRSVVPLSGLAVSAREKTDPYMREWKADPSLPVGIKGVIEGYNKLINMTPGMSDSLPLKLNLWGEPVEYEYTWSPIRMKAGKQTDADQIIIQTGTKLNMPENKMTVKTEDGISASVSLTPLEYNKLLEIANDPVYGINLQERIIEQRDYIVDLPLYQQQKALKDIVSQSFDIARDLLIAESEFGDSIRQRAEERAEQIREVGLGAK